MSRRVTVFLTASALVLSIIAVRPQQLLPDPKAMLSDLIAEVIQLHLKAGISNSFDAKLSAATSALDDSKDQNDQAAINAMYAFINAVNAQRNTRLTDAQADALVAAAQAIIQVVSTSAITFSDDFNDGNADGWWLGPSLHTGVHGNWRVENGTLVQDAPGDAFVALVQDLDVSTQSLSTDVFPFQVAGYAGLTFWHQDPQNWI